MMHVGQVKGELRQLNSQKLIYNCFHCTSRYVFGENVQGYYRIKYSLLDSDGTVELIKDVNNDLAVGLASGPCFRARQWRRHGLPGVGEPPTCRSKIRKKEDRKYLKKTKENLETFLEFLILPTRGC